jgi:hypothetical protein
MKAKVLPVARRVTAQALGPRHPRLLACQLPLPCCAARCPATRAPRAA